MFANYFAWCGSNIEFLIQTRYLGWSRLSFEPRLFLKCIVPLIIIFAYKVPKIMIHSKPCIPQKWKSWPKVIEASSHRLEKWCDTIFWFYPGGSVSPNNEVENPCRRKGSLSKFCLGFPRQEYSFLLLVNINDTKRIIIQINHPHHAMYSVH